MKGHNDVMELPEQTWCLGCQVFDAFGSDREAAGMSEHLNYLVFCEADNQIFENTPPGKFCTICGFALSLFKHPIT